MKLALVVVEDSDAIMLMDSLVEHNFSATKLASTGGFLLKGNTTLLIGIEDERLDELVSLIRKVCVRHKKLMPHIAPEMPSSISLPIEVDSGGATLFVLSVEHFAKI
jgi:uncharacterized protein YaaQ